MITNTRRELKSIEGRLRSIPHSIDSKTALLTPPKQPSPNATAGELITISNWNDAHSTASYKSALSHIMKESNRKTRAVKEDLENLRIKGYQLKAVAGYILGEQSLPADTDANLAAAATIVKQQHTIDDQASFVATLKSSVDRGLDEVDRFENTVFMSIKGAASIALHNKSAITAERFGDDDQAVFYRKCAVRAKNNSRLTREQTRKRTEDKYYG